MDTPRHPLPGLLLLASIAAVGAVIFTPALPMMTRHFGLTLVGGERLVAIYVSGYAIGQLPYGPLTNRFGDRRVLRIGILVCITGSLLAALTYYLPSFFLLAIALFLSAVGAAVGLKVTFHFIPKFYTPIEARRIASYVIASFAVAPYIGVAVGGFLTQYLGWPICFLFFTLYVLFVYAIASATLQPTADRIWDRMHMGRVATGYWAELCKPLLVVSACVWGLSTAIIYSFAAHAPFIGVEQIQLTPSVYGLWTLIPASAFFLGSIASGLLVHHLSASSSMAYSLLISAIGVIVMLVYFALNIVNVSSLFLTAAVAYAGLGPIASNASATASRSSRDKSNASSVISCINLLFALLGILIIDWINPQSAVVLPIVFIIDLALLALLLWPFSRLVKALERPNGHT